uniref:DDE Tnp4 domain-containing protein n=1 Tax=Oncorhynchus tshawytscha TaxID=74940 RepID=A0AAZ3NVY9_ONCTS
RRLWVHPINVLRREHGQYYQVVQELLLDPGRHHRYFRMSAEEMETLLSFVGLTKVSRRDFHLVLHNSSSGAVFFYYKGDFSVVLLTLVEANYRFTAIQVGDFGRNSDGGVYPNSPLGRAMASKTLLSHPDLRYLPYPGHNISYEKEISNYRLCRAIMTVEKAFGILKARWRILYQKINLQPSKVVTIVIAMCILHNFLTKPCMRGIGIQANRASQEAVSVREKFTKYFTSGSPWQRRRLRALWVQ